MTSSIWPPPIGAIMKWLGLVLLLDGWLDPCIVSRAVRACISSADLKLIVFDWAARSASFGPSGSIKSKLGLPFLVLPGWTPWLTPEMPRILLQVPAPSLRQELKPVSWSFSRGLCECQNQWAGERPTSGFWLSPWPAGRAPRSPWPTCGCVGVCVPITPH